MKKLKEILFLSDKGYTDLKKAIIACTITNLAMLLPFCITVMVFSELLNPFLGQELDWQNIWLLWGAGIISAIIVFLASKNDYRKTYIASYKESNVNFDDSRIQAQIDRVHREQGRMIPRCAVCASPCGRNEDYNMEQLWQAEENIRGRSGQARSAV